ncbi:MAG: hypothetical protein PHF51_05460 [Candidatus ainarchaeum sp.]|nr:hypothetical protein [Candidatus ainarchaeum sp.]
MERKLFAAAVALAFAFLLAGCAIPGFDRLLGATPTPTPTPRPTETPAPQRTATPTPVTCPSSCDDGNPCTADDCGPRTDFACEHIPLSGPNADCGGSAGTCLEYACANGTCGSRPKVPCCENGLCEAGETCACTDCACAGAGLCCGGQCMAAACRADDQCDDNDACTSDSCLNAGTCEAGCEHAGKTCLNFDGCCAAGCDYLNDNDCPAYSRSQWATSSSNLSIRVDTLFIRPCTRESNGKEENWAALRLTLSYGREGSAFFDPDEVTLVDDYLSRNFTPVAPTGTDCYLRDADYILTAGRVGMTEETGLIYFDYDDFPIATQSKKIVIGNGAGPRLVWLVSPTG